MLRLFLLALKALFTERERKEITTFSFKSPRIESLFQPKTGCFLHQKKEKNNCENKILARKTPLRVSRRTTQRRKRRTERERKFIRLLFFPSRAFLEDFFRARERFTERQRENERISFVCRRLLRQKTERRFRRTRIAGSEKTRRSERRFEIIRSFGDFSRSGRARVSFCSTTREQQREQQQSKKKRETFERKARGFKRDQSHLQISFAASFCVFLAGGSSVEGEVFLLKI